MEDKMDEGRVCDDCFCVLAQTQKARESFAGWCEAHAHMFPGACPN